MNERPDSLDEVLDEALTSYGIAPENEGLERRIQERVRRRTVQARRVRWLAAAMSTAAMAVFLCWWAIPKVTVQRRLPSKTALVSRTPESLQGKNILASNTKSVVALATRPGSSSRKQRGKPQLPKFPTPSFAGREQLALLQLARYEAAHGTQEVSYLGTPVKPIQIEAVEIKPLE